jgi:hypothetical protein
MNIRRVKTRCPGHLAYFDAATFAALTYSLAADILQSAPKLRRRNSDSRHHSIIAEREWHHRAQRPTLRRRLRSQFPVRTRGRRVAPAARLACHLDCASAEATNFADWERRRNYVRGRLVPSLASVPRKMRALVLRCLKFVLRPTEGPHSVSKMQARNEAPTDSRRIPVRKSRRRARRQVDALRLWRGLARLGRRGTADLLMSWTWCDFFDS